MPTKPEHAQDRPPAGRRIERTATRQLLEVDPIEPNLATGFPRLQTRLPFVRPPARRRVQARRSSPPRVRVLLPLQDWERGGSITRGADDTRRADRQGAGGGRKVCSTRPPTGRCPNLCTSCTGVHPRGPQRSIASGGSTLTPPSPPSRGSSLPVGARRSSSPAITGPEMTANALRD